ncbi:MAG: hypothetical protein LWX52_15365, partial [Deltaproteobacteria bacterium]|nr:hypothetical protein [Deltaproteobacteria bacterium]
YGEHCRFCGDKSSPLVKTRCCEQCICRDTAFFSFAVVGTANLSTNISVCATSTIMKAIKVHGKSVKNVTLFGKKNMDNTHQV